MGRQSHQADAPRRYYGFAAVTDSMVLDDRLVADAIDSPDRRPTRLPRVLIGIRNAFLLSAVLWALIVGSLLALK